MRERQSKDSYVALAASQALAVRFLGGASSFDVGTWGLLRTGTTEGTFGFREKVEPSPRARQSDGEPAVFA